MKANFLPAQNIFQTKQTSDWYFIFLYLFINRFVWSAVAIWYFDINFHTFTFIFILNISYFCIHFHIAHFINSSQYRPFHNFDIHFYVTTSYFSFSFGQFHIFKFTFKFANSYFHTDHIIFPHSFTNRPFHIFAFSFESAISFVVNSSASASDNETASDKQAGSWDANNDDDNDADNDGNDDDTVDDDDHQFLIHMMMMI